MDKDFNDFFKNRVSEIYKMPRSLWDNPYSHNFSEYVIQKNTKTQKILNHYHKITALLHLQKMLKHGGNNKRYVMVGSRYVKRLTKNELRVGIKRAAKINKSIKVDLRIYEKYVMDKRRGSTIKAGDITVNPAIVESVSSQFNYCVKITGIKGLRL